MNPARTLGTLALVAATGCSQAGLRKHYNEMRPNLVRGDWPTAAAQMEKAKEQVYGEKDRVMYWLNLGAILHYAGDIENSNSNLVNAEKAMEELWTTSVSAEASKLLVNETVQSYGGEDFEKVLLYLFTSLNHAKSGNYGDAAVEARRADELLKKMEIHSKKEGEVGTKYTQDAMMLWLVGLYYELEGPSSVNDAYLAYKAAYKAYKEDYAGFYGFPVPKFIGEDLARTAKLMGFADDLAQITAETGATGATADKMKEMGEVIVVVGTGESPYKRELRFDGQMPDGYVTSIAIPEFVAIPPQTAYATVSGGPEGPVNSEIAEPLTAIVLKNFAERLPAIKLRAIARAAIKYAATKGAQAVAGGSDSGIGALVGLVGNVAAYATEAADLRSWTLLPSEVQLARVFLPPGTHTLTVTYHNASGAPVGATETLNVEIQAGQRKIFSVRSVL